MDYEKAYEDAEKKGDTKQLTKQICTWDAEGQRLVGRVVAIDPFTDGAFESEAKVYTLETNEGLVTTVLGEATDKQLAKLDITTQPLAIIYRGKKTLADGHQCNIFDIRVFKIGTQRTGVGTQKAGSGNK